MNFVKLSDMYKKPSVYNPPNPEQLTNNADFPNLNSLEYRVKKVENTELKLQNFWEILEVDTLGQIVLVTNDYVTRIWTGSFWGYENFDDVGSETKAVYSKRYDHLITNFKFVEPNIALISDSSGGVHLWSTKSEIRNGYCPFSIIRRSEHIGRIDVLALFHRTGTKALSGCTNGCIKVWDLRGGDLSSSHTYRNAHTSHITGLSSSHTKPTVFASCSRDKKWAVWDHRNRKPITILSSTHSIPYTALYWSDSQENNENLIVGDSTGSVYTFDIRNPAKHIEMLKPLSSPIHKLSFEGKLLAVLGQTNMLKVIDTANANKEVYVNSDAKSNVRDIHWSDVDTFYTIAWETGLQKHRVANESCLQEF